MPQSTSLTDSDRDCLRRRKKPRRQQDRDITHRAILWQLSQFLLFSPQIFLSKWLITFKNTVIVQNLNIVANQEREKRRVERVERKQIATENQISTAGDWLFLLLFRFSNVPQSLESCAEGWISSAKQQLQETLKAIIRP